MLNLKLIYKILGALLLLETFVMGVALAMAVVYQEDDIMAFIIAMIVTMAAALALRFIGQDAENSLGRRDAYLLVTLTWIIFSFFGSLPFLISGYIPSFTDAYFETMSGFSTTGASIIESVESLRNTLLAFADTMDRRTRNSVLHHCHPAFAGRRKRQGVLCRSYRTYTSKDAPQTEHHSKMDLEHIPHTYITLYGVFLLRRDDSLRCH